MYKMMNKKRILLLIGSVFMMIGSVLALYPFVEINNVCMIMLSVLLFVLALTIFSAALFLQIILDVVDLMEEKKNTKK